MSKLQYKIGAALVGGVAATLMMVAPALAIGNITCTITGNGDGSTNTCRIRIRRSSHSHPPGSSNTAKVKNVVIAGADTGGNEANKNTTNGGDVSVDTGNASVKVKISNDFTQN